MEKYIYKIDGKQYVLDAEEFRPFNNNDEWHRIGIGVNTVFKLKNDDSITGVVKDIGYEYPVDGSDNPLQSKIFIETNDGSTRRFYFYEIICHSPAPITNK